MSKTKTSGEEPISAIKGCAAEHQYAGLTKREYFSALALQGLLSTGGSYFPDTQDTGMLVAAASVKYADALIEALNKETL